MKPRLAIISDTALRQNNDGWVAFEPVVRELEGIQELFSQVTWLGYKKDESRLGKNARQPQIDIPLSFVGLTAVGGPTLFSKIRAALSIPKCIFEVILVINKADVIHTRGPSLPSFIAVLLNFVWYRKKKFWHKYAGNWQEKNPPFFYNLQRKLLRLCKRSVVTINGEWPNTPKHFLSFENPCLTNTELEKNKLSEKSFNNTLRICFVGNLDENKRVLDFLQALKQVKHTSFIVTIAGNGPMKEKAQELAAEIKNHNISFLGFMNREGLGKVYKDSHFLILPSKSEGFPKVVAEACSYGTIAIVTDISCLGQYVKTKENGFLLKDGSAENIIKVLDEITNLEPGVLSGISEKSKLVAERFSYEFFKSRIDKEVIH